MAALMAHVMPILHMHMHSSAFRPWWCLPIARRSSVKFAACSATTQIACITLHAAGRRPHQGISTRYAPRRKINLPPEQQISNFFQRVHDRPRKASAKLVDYLHRGCRACCRLPKRGCCLHRLVSCRHARAFVGCLPWSTPYTHHCTELVGIREAIPSGEFTQVAIATDLCARLDALAATLSTVEVCVPVTCYCCNISDVRPASINPNANCCASSPPWPPTRSPRPPPLPA